MRLGVASIYVDDQDKALDFYIEVLGFMKKAETPTGESRWLTVVSPEDPDGVELLLEPDHHADAAPFKDALAEDGIPFVTLRVDDVPAEVARLKKLGVRFTQELLHVGEVTMAVFEDTCGNLIQIHGRP